MERLNMSSPIARRDKPVFAVEITKISKRRASPAGRLMQAAIIVSLFLLVTRPLHAATFTWNNSTGNWSSGGNWGGSGPTGTNSADVLQFINSDVGTGGANHPYTTTDDLVGLFLLNQLVFNNPDSTASGNAHTLDTPDPTLSFLKFAGASGAITQNGAGGFNIEVPMILSTGTTLGGNGAGVVTLDGAISGAAGLTKSGTSTFRLGPAGAGASNNTFVGGVTISGGTLSFNNDNAGTVGAAAGLTALRNNRVTITGGTTSTLRNDGQIMRSGEISGSTGRVINQIASGNSNAQVVLYVLSDATFSGTFTNTGTDSPTSGKLTIRGLGTQTFDGTTNSLNSFTSNPLSINNTVEVYQGAGLVLAGNASLTTAVLSGGSTISNTDGARLQILGGTVTLDNRTVNNQNRLGVTAPVTNGINGNSVLLDGGTFKLLGNSAGTSETTSELHLNQGAGKVVVQSNSSSAPTVLTFVMNRADDNNYSIRDQTGMTVDFVGENGTLGATGNNPRILFDAGGGHLGHPFLGQANLLGNSAGGSTIGWATVNGSDWATYDNTTGIKALTSTSVAGPNLGNLNSTSVAVYSPSANQSGTGTITTATLKITPTASGFNLDMGSSPLVTNALMLDGTNDFTINGTGIMGSSSGTRYIYVNNADASLTTSMDVAKLAGSNSTNKAGAGFLILSSTNASQNNLATTNRFNILAGTVRATNTNFGFTSSGAGTLSFRGGVMEIAGGLDGTDSSADFTRPLGVAAGTVNWNGINGSGANASNDVGSGGFSAFGGPASINIGGGTSLSWEDVGFVDSGSALIFGSTKSNARLTFLNPLSLTQGPLESKYNAREIRVIDNPNSSADFTRLAGTLSGGLRDDLLKTGAGTLELTGTNTTFNSGVIVAEGQLLFNNSDALGNAAYVLVGTRGALTGAASLLASNTGGSITTAREINVQAGPTGAAIIGSTIAPDAASAGDVTYTSDVSLGITGSATNRLVQLTAASGSTVTFSGGFKQVSGYTGTMNFEKIGAGIVAIGGTNTYTGTTAITNGTLRLNGTSSGTISVNASAASAGTLGGTGSVGPVTVAANAVGGNKASIAPGASIGTLTMSSLTVNGGNFQYEFGAGSPLASHDLSVVAGTANFAAVSAGNQATITPTFLGAITPGTYTIPLITAGTLTIAGGATPTLDLTSSPFLGNDRYNFSLLTTTGASGHIDLQVIYTGPLNLTWTGTGSTEWQQSSVTNWTNGSAQKYYDADQVTFDNTGLANNNLKLEHAITPGSVTFSNTSGTYTLSSTSGAGSIGGSIGILKTGAGTAVLATTNSFSGPVTVTGGTLQFTRSNNLGDASATNTLALANGTLDFAGGTLDLGATRTTAVGSTTVANASGIFSVSGTSLTMSAPISNASGALGAPGVTKTGTGTLNFSATNTYTGATTVSAGTLNLNVPQNLSKLKLDGATGVLSAVTPDSSAQSLEVTSNGGTLQHNNTTFAVNGGSGKSVTWGAGATLDVQGSVGGKLLLSATSGTTVSVADDTAKIVVHPGATLELSGTTSALQSSSGPVHFVNVQNDSTTSLHVTGAGQQVGDISGVGNTTVDAAASLTAGVIRQNDLNLAGTGTTLGTDAPTVTIRDSAPGLGGDDLNKTSIVKTLTMGNDSGTLGVDRKYFGQLDLRNNNLIIDYTGSSDPYAEIADMIRSGLNGFGYDGTGLTTSVAPENNPTAYGLGIIDNGYLIDNVGIGYGDGTDFPLFEGIAVPHDAILVKFTYRGDLNLDGVFTSDDAIAFNNNFDDGANGGHPWWEGDLNSDGFLTSDDTIFFGGNYDESAPHLPEPGSLVLAGVGAVVLIAFRRRR